MNRTRMLVLATVALVLSGAVTFLTYRALREKLQPPEQMTNVVVVLQKMAIGSRLTQADLRVTPWPKSVPLAGSFPDPAELIGRGVIVPMEPNEPVLEAKLAPKNAGAGLMTAIPDGMRAVSVKVNDVIGVAGFVVPGARVDVILSASPNGGNGPTDIAKIFLENIQVLAAGQNVERDSEGKPQSAQVITLLVTPEESEKLALVAGERIQLALRNPLDMDSTNPRGVPRIALFNGSAVAASTPEPAPKPVERVARAAKPAVAAAAPPPAPAPVAVAPPPPPEKRVLEVQLIQGSTSQILKFEQKP
jgi:pilus assembly protein CpaB